MSYPRPLDDLRYKLKSLFDLREVESLLLYSNKCRQQDHRRPFVRPSFNTVWIVYHWLTPLLPSIVPRSFNISPLFRNSFYDLTYWDNKNTLIKKAILLYTVSWYPYFIMNVDPEHKWWQSEIEKQVLKRYSDLEIKYLNNLVIHRGPSINIILKVKGKFMLHPMNFCNFHSSP